MEISDAFQVKKGARQHYYRVIHPRVVQKGKTKVFNVNLQKDVFISETSFLSLQKAMQNQEKMAGFLREANEWREQQYMQKLCLCVAPLPADLRFHIWKFVYDAKNTFEHAVFSFYREQWKAQVSSRPWIIMSYPEHVRLLLLALECPQHWKLSHARSGCGPFVCIEDTQQPSAQLFITLSAKSQNVRFDVQNVLDKRYVLDSLMSFNLHFSFHAEHNLHLTPPECVTAFLQKQFDPVV